MIVGGREVVVMASVVVSVLQSHVCVVAAVVGLGFIFAVVRSVVSSPINPVVVVGSVSGVVNPIGVVAVAVLQSQVCVVAVSVGEVAAVVGLGFISAEVGSVVSSPIFKVVVVSATRGEVATDPGNWRFLLPYFWPPSTCFFACFPFGFLLFFFSSGFFFFLDFLVVVALSVSVEGVVRSVSVLLLDSSDSSSLRTNSWLKNKDHIALNKLLHYSHNPSSGTGISISSLHTL